MNIMIKTKLFSLSCILAISLSACSTAPQGRYTANESYLKGSETSDAKEDKTSVSGGSLISSGMNADSSGMSYLSPLTTKKSAQKQAEDLTSLFSDKEMVQLAADDLALKDYLHYVFGELLGVSYILGEKVKADNKSVTLNLQQDISKRKLFTISEDILSERGYVVRHDDGIYYVHQAEGGVQGAVAYGYGNKPELVPDTSVDIIQLVPFEFGMQTSLANTIQQILKVKASVDFQRNTLILQGKRKDIIRALEFVKLMDQPLFRNRHIGVYKATYVDMETLVEKLPDLLKQEGIQVSGTGQNDQAISLVPLERTGTLISFANNKALIDRVGFWASQIDQAPRGSQVQYFFYQPKFARATDLGQSLQVLIGGAVAGGNNPLDNNTSAASQNQQTQKKVNNSTGGSISASNPDMTLVVDERANALIFSTTGDKYRQMLPLIKRLDVMPKQVILEVMIAEVKLTDEFKSGVDFELTNQGSASKVGGFNLSSGSSGLSYVLSGAQGELTFSLFQKNSNVNVLSRPSLLVRDGVEATITVGDDIPTVGATTITSENTTTSVIYRKTGVELGVKPTINARGVVIMEIDQKISNQTTGDESVEGSPIIFERSINTEVVAESGQTIVMGGLISENRTINDRRVPFFSDIPLIGGLFDGKDDTGDKTELVVLVTPKVIESPEEWGDIMEKFTTQYDELNINQ